jgi:hypothetical protein
MRGPLALVVVLALAACTPEEEPAAADVAPASALQAACEKRDGRWGRGGAAGFFLCYEQTRDGGRSCEKGTDCDGVCLARSRTCAPVKPLLGCQEVLTDNGAPATLCVD